MRILSPPELQWCASKSCNIATNKWANVLYSDRSTQDCLDWLYSHYDWQMCSDRSVICIWTRSFPVHLNFDQTPAKAVGLPRISEPCLILYLKYSIFPRVSQCQMGLANVLCWSCHNVTQAICRRFSGAPELRSYASKCRSIAVNLWAGISYSDTATQYRLLWHYCQMGLANMQGLICGHETHDRSLGYPGVHESGWILLFSISLTLKYVCALKLPMHHKFATEK